MAEGEPHRELLPAPYNVRSRVHEYGGAAWAPLADAAETGRFVFANFADQRVHLRSRASISALTPESWPHPDAGSDPQLRFAEFVPSWTDDEILAVC